MSLEPQDKCELIGRGDDAAFHAFVAKNHTGVLLIAEPTADPGVRALRQDVDDFVKWARQNNPNLGIVVEKSSYRTMRCSSDIWLPLAFIAHDVGLPLYLNLVSSYLYERMKAALKGDRHRVHLSAVYKDERSGVVKQFNFEGDAAALEKAIKRLDFNEFFGE